MVIPVLLVSSTQPHRSVDPCRGGGSGSGRGIPAIAVACRVPDSSKNSLARQAGGAHLGLPRLPATASHAAGERRPRGRAVLSRLSGFRVQSGFPVIRIPGRTVPGHRRTGLRAAGDGVLLAWVQIARYDPPLGRKGPMRAILIVPCPGAELAVIRGDARALPARAGNSQAITPSHSMSMIAGAVVVVVAGAGHPNMTASNGFGTRTASRWQSGGNASVCRIAT